MSLLTQGKTNWKYILIVLILAVIVGGEILKWIRKTEVPSIEFPEIKTPERVEDETTDWKTYKNEEYGFEIKYPEDFDIREEERAKGALLLSFCGGEYSQHCWIQGAAYHPEIILFKLRKDGEEWENEAGKISQRELYSFVFEEDKGPWKWFQYGYWPFGMSPEKLSKHCKITFATVGGKECKLWVCRAGTSLYAFWEKEKNDNFFYLMDVNFLDIFPKLNDIFNQMLSTFRFLE